MIKHLFFDLDGTLTDPQEGITKCVAYALHKVCSIEVEDLNTLVPYIGPPLVAGFQEFHGVSEETAHACTEAYRERFRDVGLFENRPYDGIRAALDGLRAEGYKLYVATSKPTEFSVRILERFGLADCFDHICGATMDGRISEKHQVIAELLRLSGNPATDEIVMIGDRKFDIIGAHAFGIRAVGVLYGFGSREELEAAGADAICESVDKLAETIASL